MICDAAGWASIQAFRKAERNKEWLIGNFWEAMWVFADVAIQRVALASRVVVGLSSERLRTALDAAGTLQ